MHAQGTYYVGSSGQRVEEFDAMIVRERGNKFVDRIKKAGKDALY